MYLRREQLARIAYEADRLNMDAVEITTDDSDRADVLYTSDGGARVRQTVSTDGEVD